MKDIELCGITSGIRLGEFTFNKVSGELKVGAGTLVDDSSIDESAIKKPVESGDSSEQLWWIV